MGFLATIGDAIWARIRPLLDEHLDEMQNTAKTELAAWRKDAITMLSEALPEMAGKIAEEAVKTTFEHTQVDEAADAVSNTIIDIIGRINIPFGLGGQR